MDDNDDRWIEGFLQTLASAEEQQRAAIPGREACCTNCAFVARLAAEVFKDLGAEAERASQDGTDPEDITLLVAQVAGRVLAAALFGAEPADEDDRRDLAKRATATFAAEMFRQAYLGEARTFSRELAGDDDMPPGTTQH